MAQSFECDEIIKKLGPSRRGGLFSFGCFVLFLVLVQHEKIQPQESQHKSDID